MNTRFKTVNIPGSIFAMKIYFLQHMRPGGDVISLSHCHSKIVKIAVLFHMAEKQKTRGRIIEEIPLL